MVNARRPIPPADPDAGLKSAPENSPGGRFNVLLTEDRVRPDEHWTRQLPRLMQPLGVEAHLAATGKQALQLAEQVTYHAAFVDLATPVDAPGRATNTPAAEGGLWLLQVLQRRTARPPVVVVNSRATRQQAVRLLNEALRLGAFSVVNRPDDLHPLLTVIQRLLDRHHQGQWPTPTPAPGNASTPNPDPPKPTDGIRRPPKST
jgi:CheY-like chemotaxis protein